MRANALRAALLAHATFVRSRQAKGYSRSSASQRNGAPADSLADPTCWNDATVVPVPEVRLTLACKAGRTGPGFAGVGLRYSKLGLAPTSVHKEESAKRQFGWCLGGKQKYGPAGRSKRFADVLVQPGHIRSPKCKQ